MKSTAIPCRVLFLLLLAALVAVGPALAAPAAAGHTAAAIDLASVLTPTAACAAAAAPAGAQFLQTSTASCTSDAQCIPLGKLCCRACAFPECTLKRCLTPMNGHCPLIP